MRFRAKPWVRVGGAAADALVGGILLLIVLVTVVATANRYLFGGAMPWSLEFSLIAWFWLIHFAALRTEHIRIDYFHRRMPDALGTVVAWFVAAVCLGSLAVLTWAAWRQAVFSADSRYTSMPWLSESVEYLPLLIVGPVWAALIVTRLVRRRIPAG